MGDVESENEVKNAALAEEIKIMQKQLQKDEHMQDLLDKARNSRDNADVERDDLKDKVAGMEARQKAKNTRHHRDMDAMKKLHLENMTNNDEKHETAKSNLLEELAAMTKQLALSKQTNKGNVSEQEIMTRSMQNEQRESAAKIADITALLHAANREIARRDAKKVGMTAKPDGDFKEQSALEDLLNNSRDSNRKLNAELAGMRLEMLSQQQSHADQVNNLQFRLDDAADASKPRARKHPQPSKK